jgi:hypothetical protein
MPYLRRGSSAVMLAEAHALGLSPFGADLGQELHLAPICT